MPIEDRIPDLSDIDLSNLLANARRLAEVAEGRRREEAERLVPLIEAELDDRRARAPLRATKIAVAPKKPRAPAAKPRAKRARTN